MNVIHELSISELAVALADIRRGLKPDGHLLLVDMCLLPEGEPQATPYYLPDIEELFGEYHDSSFTSKSGIPVIAAVIARRSIPHYAEAKAVARRILVRKRAEWAQLATRPGLNPALFEHMTGSGDEVFKLGLLSVLATNATARIDADVPTRASGDVDKAAIAIIDYFKTVFSEEGRCITVEELYNQILPLHSYEAIATAIEIQTDTGTGWFMPLLDGPASRIIPGERFDWFEDHLGTAVIKKAGLLAVVSAAADGWQVGFGF